MKTLQSYITDGQTEIFNKYGAFFAFNDKQYHERAVDGVKYAHVGAGLICPTEHTAALSEALEANYMAGVHQDIEENGVKAIIHRELANYECQITGDYDDVISALKPYDITPEQIQAEWREFYDRCVANNWF